MQYYFAPMEGLTDSFYRSIHSKHFPGIDRYYTPFFSPTQHQTLTAKEQRELPLADTLNHTLIPQVLTNNPENFLWMANICKDRGYQEVNLNLGCPSGTVTAKGKGSGMLRDLVALDRFLDSIFKDAPLPVSVKTRIGFSSADEFPEIMGVLNRYPICQLTVHPRVRDQFYKGSVDLSAFQYALNTSHFPVVYNGNLNNKTDIKQFSKDFNAVKAVMIGRGLIGDPGMLTDGGATAEQLEGFMNELLQTYTEAFGSPRNAMFRMKENWRHLLCKFENSEKLGKRLRKTTDLQEFRSITHEIFHTLPMRQDLKPDW